MTNSEAVDEYKKLLEICDQLLGPEGCAWDREQTVVSMRESVLEEACEVIEAIDIGSDQDLIEELGDLLYNVIFFCKLAEKEKRFVTKEPIERIREKLIFRHPHVFGEKKLKTAESIIEQWEEIKKKEKPHRESLLDGIPIGLPALARAYKICDKMKKMNVVETGLNDLFESEEELGDLIWRITIAAREKKINPETALRKTLAHKESFLRSKESK